MASFNKLIDHNKHMKASSSSGSWPVLFRLFGASLGAYWGGDWLTGVIIAVAVAGLYFFISWRFGASMILASSGAKEIPTTRPPALERGGGAFHRGGMPHAEGVPHRDEAMNAFATGGTPSTPACHHQGLLEKLNREELQSWPTRSHVRNYDIRSSPCSWRDEVVHCPSRRGPAEPVLQFLRRQKRGAAIPGRRAGPGNPRHRCRRPVHYRPLLASHPARGEPPEEYLADASAVELTRNPAGLISALKKLTADTAELKGASQGMQHLYIVNPLLKKKKGKDSLFSTHPALSSRIERLEGLMGASA